MTKVPHIKLSITLPEDLVVSIDKIAKANNLNRSRLMTKLLRGYIALRKQQQKEIK